MIGLLGIGLGLYGMYELTKEVKTTHQDIKIKTGVGSLYEQKSNIDTYFLDILEYGGAECKIVKDRTRRSPYIRNNIHYKIVNAKPKGYGGTELYLMEKGYSREAIDYFKNKYDDIAQKEVNQARRKKESKMEKFEKALLTQKSTEMVVKFSTNADKFLIDRKTKKMIQYLHTHNNRTARVNITMGSRYSNNDFQISWVLFVPNGYNGHEYLENVEAKIDKEMI